MDTIQTRICQIIDSHRDETIVFGLDIWENAELGFCEYHTAGKVAEKMKEL